MCVDKVRRIGSGLNSQDALNTCTTQQEVLCTLSQRKQILRRIQAGGGAAGCSRQRQEETYYLRCRDHMIFLTMGMTPVPALITTNSLDIFDVVFYVCDTTFSPGEIFVFFLSFSSLLLLPVRSIIHPPLHSFRKTAEYCFSSECKKFRRDKL